MATIAGACLERGSFDVVTMNHVIEHLADPIGDLRRVRAWLKRGGTLVVTTPNLSGLCHRIWGRAWQHLDPPRHLFIFTEPSLRRVFGAAGFERALVRASSRSAGETFNVSWALRRRGRAEGARGEEGIAVRVLGAGVRVVEELWPLRELIREELLAVAVCAGEPRGER